MWKHIQREHKNEDTEDISFNWKVSSKMRKPLERQLTESVRIARTAPEESLNSKSEYNNHSLKRLSLYRDKESFQCNECSAIFAQKHELKYHFAINHKRIVCESCDYISFGKRDIENHQMVKHGHGVS